MRDTLTKPKALGLLSGGLDSILACLVLRRAGVEVEALTFSSPFFGADKGRQAAQAHDIPLTVLEVGPEHLEKVVKNPRYGYGSNMNPCIDCHAYMFSKAVEIMDQRGFDFLFSGEVLGQRPMSQNKQALGTVAKASGAKGRILRPLSAQLMEPTPMEQSGLVDRNKLLDLSGRGRKAQMALARELGVKDYPAPAGGCLLTEPGFSKRLKDLLDDQPQAEVPLVELLKHGRHFRLSPKVKLVVGRNREENQTLNRLAPENTLKLNTQDYPGPLGLYQGPFQETDLETAARVVAGYSKAPGDKPVKVQVLGGPLLTVTPMPTRLAHRMLL